MAGQGFFVAGQGGREQSEGGVGGRGGLHRAGWGSWGSWGSKLVAQLGNNPPLINQSLTAQVIVYRLTVPSPSVIHRFRPGRLQGARTETGLAVSLTQASPCRLRTVGDCFFGTNNGMTSLVRRATIDREGRTQIGF